MASERDGGSMYMSRSQSNLTQLMTVCTRVGMGMGEGWERGKNGGRGKEGEREGNREGQMMVIVIAMKLHTETQSTVSDTT